MTMTTMIAGALAVLLAQPSPTPSPAPIPTKAAWSLGTDGAEGAKALTGRVFDLSSLTLAAPTQEFVSRTSMLLPLIDGMGDVDRSSGYLNADMNSEAEPPALMIVEAFMEAFIDGEDSKLDTVEVLDSGHVYLVGPVEVLDQFEAFAARMAAALMSNPTLEILQFRITDQVAQSLPAGVQLGGQVERAKLMTWLSSGVEFTERHIGLPGAGLRIVSDLESHTVTANVGAQIAQGSGIFEPQTFEATVGSELTLSGHRSGDSVELLYMAKSTERRDAETSRSYQLESRLYPEQGRESIDQSEAWSENFGVAGGHTVGSATIDSAHYLLLSVGTSQGQMRCFAISVDPASLATPSVSRVDAPTDLTVVTVPGGLSFQSGVELIWNRGDDVHTLESRPSEALEGSDGLYSAHLEYEDSSLLNHLMEGASVQGEHRMLSTTILVVEDKGAARIEQWANSSPSRATYHVSVKTRDALGQEHQRGSLSVQSGASGALVSGYEQLLAKGVGVEVAQRFATREVKTSTHFEGLVLSVELGQAPDGSLLYGLRGQMATDLDVSEGSANDSAHAGLVAVSAAHLFIRETGKATPSNAPGTWTVVVGDENRKGAFVELTISTQ